MLKLSLILDEFFFIVTHKRLIRFASDRAIMHRYMVMINSCGSGKCELCTEFNLNKFTYLWDGPGVYIKDFMNEVSKVDELLRDKVKMKLLFKMRE